MSTPSNAPAQTAPKSMAEMAREFGLNAEEYGVVLDRLGREPNLVELGVFSVMWSEHCSYKSSKNQLKQVPDHRPARHLRTGRERRRHRHRRRRRAASSRWRATTTPPISSPIRARRRAWAASCATSSRWARGRSPCSTPCASAIPATPRPSAWSRAWSPASAGYGNCVGVPTVAGETNFHRGYNGNILVNAMCVGLAEADKHLLLGRARRGPVGGLFRLQDRPRRHPRRDHVLGRVRRGLATRSAPPFRSATPSPRSC